MKLRRIFAALAACAIAATSVISASAADKITGDVGCGDLVLKGDDGKDYPVVSLDANGNWCFDVKTLGVLEKADGLDLTGIYGFTVTFKEMDLSNGAGGMLAINKASGWNQKSWANVAESEKGEKYDIVMDTEKFTLTRLEEAAIFSAEDVDPKGTNWASVAVGSWWGPKPEIVSISFLGKDGKVLKTFPAPAANNNSSNNNSNNNGDKKDNSNKPTGASAGLALAGLALAGVAVVATKKSK